ncbi:MAG: NTP transferase domain-containing protein [Vulcanimicrobiaceae bacterium]
MTAVVLAGGPRDAVARLEPSAPNKAFVALAGKTLLERTLEPLVAVTNIERIVVVAPPAAQSLCARYGAGLCRDGATIAASLRSGLEGLAPDELVLVVSSDLALLTSAALESFVTAAIAADADVAYACVPKAAHTGRYAAVRHTWAYLREGAFCGGGCVALRPRMLPALERFLARLGAARKDPRRLAAIFGARILIRYATRRLAIADAERRARNLLGARVAAIVSSFPEIAVNVDCPADLTMVAAMLSPASD